MREKRKEREERGDRERGRIGRNERETELTFTNLTSIKIITQNKFALRFFPSVDQYDKQSLLIILLMQSLQSGIGK